MARSRPHLSRGRRRSQRGAPLALALLAISAQAEAVTLREYFADLSDRDRGVYLTGFMDLLRADPQRESPFLECLQREGTARMHAVLADMARQEPAILSLEVAPWFFYAAHRLCPQAGPLPRPEPHRDQSATRPALAIEPSWQGRAWLALAAAAVAGVVGLGVGLLRRRRAARTEEGAQ